MPKKYRLDKKEKKGIEGQDAAAPSQFQRPMNYLVVTILKVF